MNRSELGQSGALIDSLLDNEFATEERRLLELGNKLHTRGQFDDAIETYRDVLELNPKNATAAAGIRWIEQQSALTGIAAEVAQLEVAELDVGELEDLTEHIELVGPQRTRWRLAAIVGGLMLIGLAGLIALVYQTRRDINDLSTQLLAPPAAPVEAPVRTLSLELGAEESVEYRAPVNGVVTTQPEPGQALKPGDLVAEIMNADDHEQLVRARQQYFRLWRKARRDKSLEPAAWRAKRRALRHLKSGRMTYVHASQSGVARTDPETSQVAQNGVLMTLEDPSVLSAQLPPMDGIDVTTTCRFEGDAADAACRLVFEQTIDPRGRVRVLLDNADGRFAPGQKIDVTIE